MAKLACVLLMALLGLLGPTAARAAVITASFEQLIGSTWTVEFEVTNDGEPLELTGFTVYFPQALFSNLSVAATPVAWDTIVIQPDLALASPGFFDSLLLDSMAPLLLGQTQAGFRAEFIFLGVGVPPMLPFEIVDQQFNVLFAGVTTLIPEVSTWLMLVVGLGILAFQRRFHLA